MKKESKIIVLLLTSLLLSANFAFAQAYFGSNTTEKLIPNCTVRREYNDFTGQWTNNEVCFPKVVTVPVKPTPACNTCGSSSYSSSYYGGFSASQYLLSSFGNTSYVNNNVSKPATTYYNNTYTRPYVGYYANNPYTTNAGYYTNAVNYYTPSIYDYDYGYDEDYYPYYGSSLYDDVVESYYNSYGDSYFEEPSYAGETYSSWAELDGYYY